jgi:hypothetical protein
VDSRLDPVPVVAAFAQAVRPVVGAVGLYAGGSLASGDYHPAVSDLDLVAVITARLDARKQHELRQLHETIRQGHPPAARLHCIYVPHGEVADVKAAHVMWTHGQLAHRCLSGIARAELLRNGITVYGPPPAELLPPVDDAALRVAVRAELTGYWRKSVRWPWLWLNDWCVDLGLLTLARAEAALDDGQLITKSEALGHLDRFGVPADLSRQIGRRRQGKNTPLSAIQRVRRAYIARRVVSCGLRTLTSADASHRKNDNGS